MRNLYYVRPNSVESAAPYKTVNGYLCDTPGRRRHGGDFVKKIKQIALPFMRILLSPEQS